MQDVVIAGYLRTAQSRSRPNDPDRDWLSKLRSDDMLAKLLPELLKRANVEPEAVDDFIVGCAQGVSEQWTMGGRIPILLANLPETIAAKSVDQQCGSAMAAVQIGAMEIQTGTADIVMCGGMEHMTRVPMGGNGAIRTALTTLKMAVLAPIPMARVTIATVAKTGCLSIWRTAYRRS